MRTGDKTLRRRMPVLLIIMLGVLAALAGVTAARYVMQRTDQSIVAAQDFYFTSDFLKEEGEAALYYIDSKLPVSIHLYNAEDSLRVTPGDIQYKVEVAGGTYTDSGNGILSATGGAPVLAVSDLVVTSQDSVTAVEVKVTTESPYQKVLSAKFMVAKGNMASIEDAAGKRAAVLTMTCVDDEKEIEITLPSGVIPDETNDNVISFDTASGMCRFQSPGHGIYSLTLLKSEQDKVLRLESGDTFAGALVIQQ